MYCIGVCVQVTLYTEQGWQEDLPRLLAGREGHGCGHFMNEDGVLVNMTMKAAQFTLYTGCPKSVLTLFLAVKAAQ